MRAPAAGMPLRYGPSRNDSSCKQSSACSPYLFCFIVTIPVCTNSLIQCKVGSYTAGHTEIYAWGEHACSLNQEAPAARHGSVRFQTAIRNICVSF